MCRAVFVVVFLSLFAFGCDLNENSCEIITKHGKGVVSLSPKPIKPMIESKVEFQGLKGFKKPRIHLYGLSMYLGHLRDDLVADENGVLKADIMIAPCSDEVMLFRLEILDGDEVSGYIDFKMFQ